MRKFFCFFVINNYAFYSVVFGTDGFLIKNTFLKQNYDQKLYSENEVLQNQLSAIDRQIEELKQMQLGFRARALRHEDQAQRLQFEERAFLETRRHLELAEENWEKVKKIENKIQQLEEEKERIISSHR